MANEVEISIVIPCRNEVKHIKQCIDSILTQTTAPAFEILVCDGLSDDGTLEVLRIYDQSKNVRVIENLAQVTPIALNLGIKAAQGKYIMILGAHATLEASYLRTAIDLLESGKYDCVGGVLENIPENKTAESIAMAMSSPFGVGNALFRTTDKSQLVDTVAFGCYKKEVFEQLGLFDEQLVRNQDDEFNFRMQQAGMKIYLSTDLKAQYFTRGNFQKLAKQYYQYGYWKVFVNQKHKAVTTFRQMVPPVFVFGNISLLLIAIFWPIAFPLWAGLLAFYFIAAFIFAIKVTNKVSKAPSIVRSFFILHWEYGLGYLAGIWDFVILKKQPQANASELSR